MILGMKCQQRIDLIRGQTEHKYKPMTELLNCMPRVAMHIHTNYGDLRGHERMEND